MIRTGPMAWPGGEHDFALPLGQLRALQRNCDAGPQQIYDRISDGTYKVDDLVEVIRLGLVGAGSMAESEAGPEVTRLFGLHGLLAFRPIAQAILGVALVGSQDDPVGKPAGATAPPPVSGLSPSSTGTAP